MQSDHPQSQRSGPNQQNLLSHNTWEHARFDFEIEQQTSQPDSSAQTFSPVSPVEESRSDPHPISTSYSPRSIPAHTSAGYAAVPMSDPASEYRNLPQNGPTMSANRSSEKLVKRSSYQKWSQIAMKPRFGWWWEAGGLLLASICMSLIIAILSYMDQKPLIDWKLPIQPNSLVAVFSTIAKSALLVPIADCLGQLKWVYFESVNARNLSQIQVFDEASRGPWGAFVFLSKLRRRSIPLLASLAAITTILLLAFEPFAQQVIEYPSRDDWTMEEGGSVSASISFPAGENSTGWLKPSSGKSSTMTLQCLEKKTHLRTDC